MRLPILLLAALPTVAPAQGLNRPLLGSPGSLDAFGVMPDMIPEGRWDWGAIPGYGMAAARPHALSPNIADAVLVLTCLEGRAGPELNIYVNYWLRDPSDATPETGVGLVLDALTGNFDDLTAPAYDPEEVYTIDIFNSLRSGRPASYDLGNGIVPTTGVSFAYNEAPPQAYHDATMAFREGARALPPEGEIVLRFLPTRDHTEEAKLEFPVEGLAQALEEVETRSYICP